MIVKGKRYGVKTFIVQLRDPQTFKTLAGIVIGDIGAKMGRAGTGNVMMMKKITDGFNSHMSESLDPIC